MISPDRPMDLLGEVARLIQHATSTSSVRFLAFVDSRKQTEQISMIANRLEAEERDDASDVEDNYLEPLERLGCLPYRAGYEAHDRAVIDRRLADGTLRGVVSTSALELGIDLPDFDLAILVGVPRSATSLTQRIGRIGRARPGIVWLVNGGDVFDEAVFREPASALARPPAEGALYLDNRRVQYIHAMCLAGEGGEHDALVPSPSSGLTSEVPWPEGFLELCASERSGEIPAELSPMRSEAGSDPHHAYPLRDVELQFKIEEWQGTQLVGRKGQLSFGQVMREAYPGGVYHYLTQPFRVVQISIPKRQIRVRRERRYSTKPQVLPIQVLPDLLQVHRQLGAGTMQLLECNVWIRENVIGFKERRGSTEETRAYPLTAPIYFPQAFFSRNYTSTAAIIYHEQFDADYEGSYKNLETAGRLIFESLLMLAPFERQDLGWTVGRYKGSNTSLPKQARFIAVFDQTYGSLHLSGRVLSAEFPQKLFANARWLGEAQEGLDPRSLILLDALTLRAGELRERSVHSVGAAGPVWSAEMVRVLMPLSRGFVPTENNSEIAILDVFFSPSLGIAYKYKPLSFSPNVGSTYTIPADRVSGCPGECSYGFFNPETADLAADPAGLT